ncbi:MAG: hypothetical protein ABI367_04385 [Mucilaginibacter sp.]
MKNTLYVLFLTLFLAVYFSEAATAEDSLMVHKAVISNNIKRVGFKSKEKIIQRKNDTIELVKFWSVAIVACLLLLVIALLMGNIKRTATTNLQLQELNNEIVRQKDNVDRINHHLEEIINDRTKDLQTKNRKLSEYSSYLSHQIRGPIATLKGLINLEKEELISKEECIEMMGKCVSEIDEKIIEMSEILRNSPKP